MKTKIEEFGYNGNLTILELIKQMLKDDKRNTNLELVFRNSVKPDAISDLKPTIWDIEINMKKR